MNGNCHFVYGASIAIPIVLIANLNVEAGTLLISTALIGSIFPDIDTPDSTFGTLSRPISTVIGKVSKVFGKTGYNHRGILHDMSLYLAGFVLSLLYCPALFGFFVGALSHLILDMFNPMGIPVLFVTKVRLGRIKSGSRESIVLTWVFTILNLAFGITYKILNVNYSVIQLPSL